MADIVPASARPQIGRREASPGVALEVVGGRRMTAAQSFILPAAADRSDMLGRIIRFCHQLGVEKRWRVTIEPYVRRRSNDQNSLLWSLYADTLKAGGESLAGWDKDDLHEWALGEHFGWAELHALDGRRRLKPLKRSSKLTTVEFSEFVEWFVRRMAEFGIYLELPGEPE
jgi:hypothetical protein